MMLIIFILTFVLSACGSDQVLVPESPIQPDENTTTIIQGVSAFDILASGQGATSASMTVFENGKYTEDLFGSAETDTTYRIASCSKVLTAAGIIKMDIGSEPMDTFYHHAVYSQMNVSQLLSHSGGWDIDKMKLSPLSLENLALVEKEFNGIGPNQLAEFYADVPLNFQPGTMQSYSSLGYVLLGGVIDQIEGNYETFIQDQIIGHTRMKVGLGSKEPEYIAQGSIDPYVFRMNELKGTMGWVSNTHDFLEFFLNLKKDEAYSIMFQKPDAIIATDYINREIYGHGVRIFKTNGKKFYACEGIISGSVAYGIVTEDGSKGIMLSMNTDADIIPVRKFALEMIQK